MENGLAHCNDFEEQVTSRYYVLKMQATIKNDTTLEQIQLLFNETYPNLWIDFYPYFDYGVDGIREKLNPKVRLDKVCLALNSGFINFPATKTVDELKADFIKSLGIVIDALRKSGNVWVSIRL